MPVLDSKVYLNGFNTSICFQNYKTYYFFSPVKKFSTNKNFSLISKIFHKLTWSIRFSTNKEVFHKQKFFLDQGSFQQTKIFPWQRKLSTNEEVFHKQNFFLDQEVFHSQFFFPQRSKNFLKAKILNSFNTKFYAKICLTL